MSTCDSTRTYIYLSTIDINTSMGVIYNAAIKIGKACKPKWYRYTPKPTQPHETPQPTPTSTPSISKSITPTPSISRSTTPPPSSTPNPPQTTPGLPINTPTPSVSVSHSPPPKRQKKSFLEKLLDWLKSLFS